MDQDKIRAFFALKLPGTALTQINSLLLPMKRAFPRYIRWLSPDHLHVTIKFIGAFNPEHQPHIKNELTVSLKGFGIIRLAVHSIGVFPSKTYPRVAWIDFKHTSRLAEMSEVIESTTGAFGYTREKRKFSPHLTFGRIKKTAPNETRAKISRFANDFQTTEIDTIIIHKINFLKSTLTPIGAVYTKLFDIHL